MNLNMENQNWTVVSYKKSQKLDPPIYISSRVDHSHKPPSSCSFHRNHPPYNTGETYFPRKNMVFSINHYWNGFDEQGNEQWFDELNDGTIISNKN